MLRNFLIGLSGLLLAGCAVQRAVMAQSAQEKMVGLNKEPVLACMGPPGQKTAKGVTEVCLVVRETTASPRS